MPALNQRVANVLLNARAMLFGDTYKKYYIIKHRGLF
jgi:hypothetical protein